MPANASSYGFNTELELEYRQLLDKSNRLEDRLEAYDFLTDMEVGDTPLIRARNLEREFNIRQIFLKFEGGNPTGTQKDRIAFAQCRDAIRRGFEVLALATCGNYGVACALAAKYAGLDCRIFIPSSYHSKRVDEMEKLGASITRIEGDYETTVVASQKMAADNEWYDANPGGENTPLQLRAYGEIAFEIYDELRDAPKVVAAPVSNGTVLTGIYKGFVSLYRRGKTSRIPRIVAGSANKKNPIVMSLLSGKPNYEDLPPDDIHETIINEPLINWHSFDGDITFDAILNSKGWARNVTDKRMTDLAKLLKDREGLNVLPASTAGLAAFVEPPKPEMVQNDRFVILLTSRR